MKYPGLSGITFRQIEIFLTAAKYENFRETAQELYLTQATVSRSIQSMEQALGLVLFTRHRKRVSLTKAGKGLAAALRKLLQSTERALDDAFELQQNQFQHLTIADHSSTKMDGYLLPIVRDFERQHPEVELSIQRETIDAILEGLRTGRYDVAFAVGLDLDSLPIEHLAYEKIIDLTPCIVIARGHPLFGQADLTWKELSGSTLLSMREGLYRNYFEFARSVCRETGLDPARVKFVRNESTIAMELKRGANMVIMDSFFEPINPEDLRYIPLPPCDTHSGIAVLWSTECQTPSLKLFLESVYSTARELRKL